MNKNTRIEKCLTFLNYFYKLKEIERAGWKTKLLLNRPESVAEHTLTTMALTLIIAECSNYSPTRVLKMIKMAMIHDLGESIIGDYIPNTIEQAEKRRLEEDAINNIVSEIPLRKIRNDYFKAWTEFDENKTEDSKLIHMIDKLDMALQARYYKGNNKNINRKDVKPFFDSALRYVMDVASHSSHSSKTKDVEKQLNHDKKQYTDEIEQILLYF